MKRTTNLKAVGLGVLAFLGGYVALAIPLTVVINSMERVPEWFGTVMTWALNLLPALSGFVGAYMSQSRNVLIGVVAGALCIAGIFASTVAINGLEPSVLFNVSLLLLVVWLGSIFGQHARSRRGA